jgi:hypothetical protein
MPLISPQGFLLLSFFMFVVLLNISKLIIVCMSFTQCHHGMMLIFIYCLSILWGMASDRVSCTVMAVSKQASYLHSGLTILFSFSILAEFLPFQIFEEVGEYPKHGILVCLWARDSVIGWYLCLVAVIVKRSRLVYTTADIADWWCADEICKAVYDIHKQINLRVICG